MNACRKERIRTEMNEKKELAGSIGSSELSALQFHMPHLLDRPFSRDIFLMKTNTAGCGHVIDIEVHLEKMQQGQKLILLREPENPYDKRAILVMDGDFKLGYVPRKDNGILSRLMDAGKYLYATADSILCDPAGVDFPWEALIISIYMQD